MEYYVDVKMMMYTYLLTWEDISNIADLKKQAQNGMCYLISAKLSAYISTQPFNNPAKMFTKVQGFGAIFIFFYFSPLFPS